MSVPGGHSHDPVAVRLLVLDIRWPPETFLMRKILALARHGYQITAVTTDAPRAPAPANVRILTIPGSRRQWWKALTLACRALLSNARQALRGAREMIAGGPDGWRLGVRRLAIAAEQPQIVHWEWTFSAIPCLPLLKERRKWHAVVSCRGAHVSIAPVNPRRSFEARRLRDIFESCCYVHAVSEDIVDDAVQHGLGRDKVKVIRPAVDPEDFCVAGSREAGSRVRVIMTGALIWRKAMEHALMAVFLAREEGVDIELEVLGGAGKEEASRFQYTVEDLGLRGLVHWRGEVPPDEVRKRLQAADIFLHASHSEGISNAVLEAMACGLPVVCTDAGGMREAVRHGIDGFLVPVRDVEAMAAAIAKMARDPTLRRRIGEAARKRIIEEFTLERQTREWRDLYEGLLKACRH